jgi:hypothetical protein
MEGSLLNSKLDLPFLYDLKPYIRYLIVLPLLIFAETIIDPLIAYVLQSINNSGIIGDEKDKEQYRLAIKKLDARKNSVIADIVILIVSLSTILSFLLSLEKLDVSTDFTSWLVVHHGSDPTLTYTGWWFLLVSSPLLQIILFRWFWRFYLWGEFLYRVSRINLNLQPTHPDLSGGLGILKNGENAFILLFFSLGIMLSVSLAEEIIYTDMTFHMSIPIASAYVITSIILMVFPMFFFTRQLIIARVKGRMKYGALGYRLSRSFDEKWADPGDLSNGEELLKTADASAVCDYSDIYDVVRQMRITPVSIRTYITQAIALVVPFLPLVFTEWGFADVFKRVLDTLI